MDAKHAQTFERPGNNSTGARPSQLDSTYRTLDRDGAARREGAQRSRDGEFRMAIEFDFHIH